YDMETRNTPPEQPASEQQWSERAAGAVADILRKYQEASEYGPRRLGRFMDEVIALAPAQDPEVGVALFTAMVGSEDLRDVAGVCIDRLYAVDREAGMRLWRVLVQDGNLGLAISARDTVEIAQERGEILPEDAGALFAAFDAAEDTRLPEPRQSEEEFA